MRHVVCVRKIRPAIRLNSCDVAEVMMSFNFYFLFEMG
jgi:hypothetical protein